MAEITKQTGLLGLVDTDTFLFGEVSPDSIINYEFEFKGNEFQIEYLEKGCGCTSAYYDRADNKIKGELNIAKTQREEFPKGETAIVKKVFVWLNDGQPRYTANERKEKQQNPLKGWFQLTLSGKVVVQ